MLSGILILIICIMVPAMAGLAQRNHELSKFIRRWVGAREGGVTLHIRDPKTGRITKAIKL